MEGNNTFHMVNNVGYRKSKPPHSSGAHYYSTPRFQDETPRSPDSNPQENVKVQSNSREKNCGQYPVILVACTVVTVALVCLGVTVFVAFSNIKAVQSDVQQITSNTNTTLFEKIQQLNTSLMEMIRSVNNSQSVRVVQLVEETILTSANLLKGKLSFQ